MVSRSIAISIGSHLTRVSPAPARFRAEEVEWSIRAAWWLEVEAAEADERADHACRPQP